MASLNRCTFIGNLGRDAELKYTPGGQAVSTFSMACTETWNDKAGQKQERTEWVRVVLWRKMAESLTEYLVKGKQVYAEGRLQTRQWTDKDGVKRSMTEIQCDRIVLLGGGPKTNYATAPAETTSAEPQAGPSDLNDDDIPF